MITPKGRDYVSLDSNTPVPFIGRVPTQEVSLHILPKRRSIFGGMYGVVSLKKEPFLTTAVKAPSPAVNSFRMAITVNSISLLIFVTEMHHVLCEIF